MRLQQGAGGIFIGGEPELLDQGVQRFPLPVLPRSDPGKLDQRRVTPLHEADQDAARLL